MFKLLSLRVSSLPTCERQCVLVFDEMSLSCLLSYDKNLDRVIGYTDDGTIATYALVFMVRGLKTKWKQAVSFFFTHNTVATSMLSSLITECIRKLRDIALFTRCIVCDQGATNVAAISILGATASLPHFSVDGCLVHIVCDVPHLLKSIQNKFLKYDIQIEGSVASWKHIDHFYQQDKVSPIRLVPRLTDRHVEINNVQKMRVSLAAQVLSCWFRNACHDSI